MSSFKSESYGTTAEVAEKLRRHPKTIQKQCRLGIIPGARKDGKRWLIPWRSVQRLVKSLPVGGF